MPFFASPTSKSGTHNRKVLLAASVAAGMAMFGGAARADIMIKESPGMPPGNEENILFSQKFTDLTTFSGSTDKTNVPIIFDVFPGANTGPYPVETVISDGGIGQAFIQCDMNCNPFTTGGANGHQLTDLEVKLGAGFGATDFIGNLDFGEGTAEITVDDQFGNSFTYTLGNGENFFTLTATNGEVITDIKIQNDDPGSNFGFNDFKQPRISGLCTLMEDNSCTAILVPEPSSLALFGSGLFAAGWFARRRKARCRA